MRILFVDAVPLAYDTTTPSTRPLGGTQSAVVYLSAALAKAGHEVAVINSIHGECRETIETDGVRFLALPVPAPEINRYDAVIVVSQSFGSVLRRAGCIRPLIMWCHHNVDQRNVQALHNPTEQRLYKRFVMVSQWQAERYCEVFGLDPRNVKVLRNAVAPAFLCDGSSRRWRPDDPPILGYSSQPYRGLDLLLLSFAAIRAQLEGAKLRLFCDFGLDSLASLRHLAEALEGVEIVGSLPQPRLAEALADINIWAYPSTFAETACISAMEAMAAGTLLVTSDLGALPETTAGFAHTLGVNIGDDSLRFSGQVATRFASHLVQSVSQARATPLQTQDLLTEQANFARSHYDWATRAREWIEWLEQVV